MGNNQENVINKVLPGDSQIDLKIEEQKLASPKTEKTQAIKKNKTSSKDEEKREFLPNPKNHAKKMKAMLKTPLSSKARSHSKTKKHPKLSRGLKIASFAVLATLVGLFAYNTINAAKYNNTPTTKDPYTSDNIFDANDNDIEFGDDGQIVIDTMDESEKNVLTKTIGELIFNDAQSRCSSEIGNIKNVLSISLLPYNLNDKNNEYDKYYLSILFSDEHDTYCLNYLTGVDFISNAEFTKDFFIDFINYLNFECAIDTCSKMNDDAKQIKGLFEDAAFVGAAYKGYWGNGDRYYFIPVYNSDGVGKTYYAWAKSIDSFEQNPMQVLYSELTSEDQEKTFDFMEFTPSENLQKIFSIMKEQLSIGQADTLQSTAYHALQKSSSKTKKHESFEDEDILY